MSKRCLLTLSATTAMVLVVGLLALPAPAAAQFTDCVDCELLTNECVGNDNSSACECVIKKINGTFVCRTQNFTCTMSGSCSGGPQPFSTSRIAVTPGALTQLYEREPLLAIVLQALVTQENKRPFLAIESYPHGTLNGKEGQYTHRAMFFPRAGNEAGFHIVLESAADKSTVTFAGIIYEQARRIEYKKLSQLPGGPVHREGIDWKMAH